MSIHRLSNNIGLRNQTLNNQWKYPPFIIENKIEIHQLLHRQVSSHSTNLWYLEKRSEIRHLLLKNVAKLQICNRQFLLASCLIGISSPIHHQRLKLCFFLSFLSHGRSKKRRKGKTFVVKILSRIVHKLFDYCLFLLVWKKKISVAHFTNFEMSFFVWFCFMLILILLL